jgi:thiosulfate reductase cytochrome b subunit
MSSSGSAPVPIATSMRGGESTDSALRNRARHSAVVRVTHWMVTLCFLALLVTGVEILISHPRFYWGETGNVLTKPLFKIPIPSSRALVPTGYNYVLPDQNGWSRALHFQSAWLLVFAGLAYVIAAMWTKHLRRNLMPRGDDLSLESIGAVVEHHLRFRPPSEAEAWSYNVLQRLSYLAVVFVLFPLVIWTGLALSPAFDSAFPATVTLLGGRQSARTLHFFVSIALVLFVFVHVMMVWRAGFINRVMAMITGRVKKGSERV